MWVKRFLMDQATGGDTGAAATATTAATTTTATTSDTKPATTAVTDTTATTAAATTTATTTTAAPKGNWPDNWQDLLAKGDEKRAAHIKRYASPDAVADALIAAQTRIRSGELKPVLAKDAKPEEVAAWRKDMGIPEKPEAYEFKDLKIPDTDKAFVGEFLKAAHGAHYTPEQAEVALKSYYAELDRQGQVRLENDEKDRLATIDALTAEYGGQFSRNRNLISGLVSKFPEGARDALLNARSPDGKALFNNPDFLRGMVALALDVNPAGIVVPAGGNEGQAMKDEIAQIEKWMSAPKRSAEGKKYWGDEKIQERYRQLLDAQQKLQQKAA